MAVKNNHHTAHVNIIEPESTIGTNDTLQWSYLQNDDLSSSDSDFIMSNVHRKLRTVSIRPSVQFPTDAIFKIDQCFGTPSVSSSVLAADQRASDDRDNLDEPRILKSPLATSDDHHHYDTTDVAPAVPALAELVPLPIPPDRRARLCFDETLVVSVELPSDVNAVEESDLSELIRPLLDVDRLRHLGGMTIRVKTVPEPGNKTADLFNVFVASDFSHPQRPASVIMSIQATVDPSFVLVKERRTEAVCSKASKEELYLNVKMNRDRDAYTVQTVHTESELCLRRSGQLNREQSGNFLLDGGGFLLMRYMVQERFVGRLETVGLYVTGELCRSTYCFSRKTNVLVNNRLCNVVKVRRCIWRKLYVPDVSISVYLESGHLVRHTWQDCDYVVHVQPLQDVNRLLDSVSLQQPVDERWRNDVGLFEEYMAMRADRVVDLRAYVRRSGQLTALIRDYVFGVLRTKPKNVLNFTVSYFDGAEGESDE